MVLFAWTSLRLCAFTICSKTHAVMWKNIQNHGLSQLSNSWNQKVFCSLEMWKMEGSNCVLTWMKAVSIRMKKDFAGVISDCKLLQMYDSVWKKNTLIRSQGILDNTNDNHAGMLLVDVIWDTQLIPILPSHSFSSNNLLVKHG